MKYPLLSNAFSNSDILEGQKILKSKQITMSTKTKLFEKEFAKYIGSKYALMVNSGSSANLLALSLLTNPMRKRRLMPGDEIIIPVVCWSTSLWPIIQAGLKPKFVDIEPNTLNLSISDMLSSVCLLFYAYVDISVLAEIASESATLTNLLCAFHIGLTPFWSCATCSSFILVVISFMRLLAFLDLKTQYESFYAFSNFETNTGIFFKYPRRWKNKPLAFRDKIMPP